MVENNQSNQNTKPITPNPTPFPHEPLNQRDETANEPFLKRGIEEDETDANYMGLLPLESCASSSSSKRTRLYNFDDNSSGPNCDPKGKKPMTDDNNIIIISDSDDCDDEKQKKEITENQIPLVLDINAYNISSESDDTDDDDDDDDDTPRNNHPIEINQYEYEEWRRHWHNCIYRDVAKRYASQFHIPFEAHIHTPYVPYVPQMEYECFGSPTPFSEAMKAIRKRVVKCKIDDFFYESDTWVPKRNYGEDMVLERSSVPSLEELSLNILAKHADAIVSLDGVSDELKQRLCKLVCDYRKMNGHFLELFLSGFPTEIRIKDCSWMTEEEFTKYFGRLLTSTLEVIQLDQCGRIITDDTLLVTLARSPNSLAKLISLSIRGACRLTDKGLQSLVSSATALRSLNLSQCSLLTFASLTILADSLGSLLKELYLDDCILIDATKNLLALKRLEQLEVLSLAGVPTVNDEFIKDYIIACGHNIKELVLRDCLKLTDASMKVIAEHCPGLHALDLMNLNKLTDFSIAYLANCCQALHTLKLRRNRFSDEAIAAFLEITGKSLEELSLNSITKVGQQTALSLANSAKNLHTLDLSWCRNLTDNELGLIVDSCLSLRLLKLFGCSKITDVFLKRHSNSKIQIIGLKLCPILQHMEEPNPRQGVLRYSSVSQ